MDDTLWERNVLDSYYNSNVHFGGWIGKKIAVIMAICMIVLILFGILAKEYCTKT